MKTEKSIQLANFASVRLCPSPSKLISQYLWEEISFSSFQILFGLLSRVNNFSLIFRLYSSVVYGPIQRFRNQKTYDCNMQKSVHMSAYPISWIATQILYALWYDDICVYCVLYTGTVWLSCIPLHTDTTCTVWSVTPRITLLRNTQCGMEWELMTHWYDTVPSGGGLLRR